MHNQNVNVRREDDKDSLVEVPFRLFVVNIDGRVTVNTVYNANEALLTVGFKPQTV